MNLPEATRIRLHLQHQVILQLTQGMSEMDLRTELIPGKWTALDNIAHLSVYQYTFLNRMKRIVAGVQPNFDRYVSENDPLFEQHRQRNLEWIWNDLVMKRLELENEINGISPLQLKQTGKHPVFGWMDVLGWTEFFLLHESHHIYTIFRLCREWQNRQYTG